MKSTLGRFFAFIGVLTTITFLLMAFMAYRGLHHFMGPEDAVVKKNAILVLDLRGMILDGRKFLKDLRKYRDSESIKGVIVRIDSPGGVVGPSQEMYEELRRTREELKKPVIASVSGLAASGAFYAAVAADKIITNPGSIMGSIGVIMEFANLEDLYGWAKIKRYSLKTGKYKDAGADYRAMTGEEKELFQSMIDEVLSQFVKAVAQGRKLPEDKVRAIADGRILTGESAVKLGLADQVGTFTDAVKLAGELTGLGSDPELFVPPKAQSNPFDFMMSFDDEEESEAKSVAKIVDSFTRRQLLGKPLFLMPGVIGD